MVAAGSHQSDSPVPGGNDNLYLIGVAGAIAISLLLVVMAILVIIRRHHQSKKVEARVDLNQHIYDTPDSFDLKPSLPPRPSKFQRTGQLLCSVDTKQLPIENAQNYTKIEESWKGDLKETSYTQLTDDCCRKQLNNDSPEDNASPSIPVQVKGTVMHVLDHIERMEELCDPNSSNFPKLNVLSSGQTSGYEQIQGYEKIQSYEKIRHCDDNLAQLVDEAQVETVTNPASTFASSKRTFGSSEDSQAQCYLADSCHECKEHNLEISPRACKNQDIENNITESNFVRVPIALDSASVQIESPVVPDDVYENEGLQENDTETCFEGSNSNSGGYERICHYERIKHCDVNLAHLLSPTIAEDVVNTASSE